jgi:Tfp pilus assembly protein PilF
MTITYLRKMSAHQVKKYLYSPRENPMKRKSYRSSATVLLGSVFLFGLGGCSSTLNFSTWLPSPGQDENYFTARKNKQDIQAIYRLACIYQEKNQHQMALEEFKRVLRLDPNHAQSYNGMGISYDRQGNYSRALGCYTAALKIKPDLDYVHNNMGYSYLLQGESAQAAAAFQKAIALNKTNDRYRNNLGVAYAQMGKINLALAEFKSTENETAISAPATQENSLNHQAVNRQTEEIIPTASLCSDRCPATGANGSGNGNSELRHPQTTPTAAKTMPATRNGRTGKYGNGKGGSNDERHSGNGPGSPARTADYGKNQPRTPCCSGRAPCSQ